MKKFFVLFLAVFVCLTLCACSSGSDNTQTNANDEEVVETTVAEKENKTIDFSVDKGEIKYAGIEKANEGLCDEENVLVVKFTFTNKQDIPAQSQNVFGIKFFQNGVEMNDSLSWSSKGGDQYELVGNYFSSVLNGGSVTYGKLVKLTDNSPITIMVTENGASDNYQMMEVDINKAGSSSEETDETEGVTDNAVSETTASTVSELWSADYYVDDFDEPTDEWFILNNSLFTGTFSNSATTDSKLTVQALIDCNKEIVFFLYEYGRNQVKNSSENYVDEYKITMRTADGKDHNITGTVYCGGDRLFIDEQHVDTVLKAIKGEGDVKFRIVNKERTVETYLFTLKTENFAEVYNSKVGK